MRTRAMKTIIPLHPEGAKPAANQATNQIAMLTELQTRTLDAVLDLIIPAATERGLPGAAEVGVLAYMTREAPEAIPIAAGELDRLDTESRRHFDLPPAAIDDAQRLALIESIRREIPAYLDRLAFETYSCYYQDDRVLDVIGLEKRPPYPTGYEVDAGDLGLLEAVRSRGQIYREV
ncbi:MAG: gluconate 2-dehydrogenase subunit 3 family protein [Rubrivivax sp.]